MNILNAIAYDSQLEAIEYAAYWKFHTTSYCIQHVSTSPLFGDQLLFRDYLLFINKGYGTTDPR